MLLTKFIHYLDICLHISWLIAISKINRP
jgi:hypothetical protein